ncbi:uncharacterized protein LOC126660121 isoform X2 [Mercurialis annua]|uniref:uncharacterized protein LOC126660121 isoform X2 n=1 Tax=Mercurialis annua TaxID=3986 RepID=UPI00215FDAAC|nr:uncharacterized protein LOC126660121 isoform X2 [Mercurialis annua]
MSELMKSYIAVDNEGLAVYESPSLKRKAAFHDSSDTDEEKEDKSDGDAAASEGGEDAAASEGREDAAASEGGKDYAAFEGTDEEKREMQEYLRIVAESDGFNIGKALTAHHIGGTEVLDVKDLEDARTTDCIEAVTLAIELENEVEGANLEFVEVIKANWTGFTYYWVTFTAKNKTTGKVDTYQSKIFNNLAAGEIEVDSFNLKPSGDSTEFVHSAGK